MKAGEKIVRALDNQKCANKCLYVTPLNMTLASVTGGKPPKHSSSISDMDLVLQLFPAIAARAFAKHLSDLGELVLTP